MTINIENVCPDFFGFWEQARVCGVAEQKRLWHTLYEDRHSELFALYYSKYTLPAELDKALTRFDRVVPALRALIPRLEQGIARVLPLCASLFAVPESEVRYVLMVGVFASNCWVESFRDAWTAFFAAEQMTTYAPGLDIGIAHETAHVLHLRCTPAPLALSPLAMGLFLEGLASCVTTLLYPDADDAAHLNMTPDVVAACEAHWDDLRRRILRDLNQVDLERAGPYFLADDALAAQAGIPTRAGYFVGYRIVRALCQHYTIADMARWSLDRIQTEERQMLERLDQLRGATT